MDKRAFILLSGGPDSTVLAYWLKKENYNLDALFIDYGHPTGFFELNAIRSFVEDLRIKLHIIDMHSLWKSFENIQADRKEVIFIGGCRDPVPQLLIASTYVIGSGAKQLFVGIHKNDLLNAPFLVDVLKSQENVIKAVPYDLWQGFSYQFPFREREKKEIIKLGVELNVPLEKTWSCHVANGSELGIQCGSCGGCMSRKSAFIEAGISDNTAYLQNHEKSS